MAVETAGTVAAVIVEVAVATTTTTTTMTMMMGSVVVGTISTSSSNSEGGDHDDRRNWDPVAFAGCGRTQLLGTDQKLGALIPGARGMDGRHIIDRHLDIEDVLRSETRSTVYKTVYLYT